MTAPDDQMTVLLDRACRGVASVAEAELLRTTVRGLQQQIAAARAFAAEMADYCSPHGVSAVYAERLTDCLDTAPTTT